MEVTIKRHCVESDSEQGLSLLQRNLLDHPAKIRIASAPTGAGKSYAFERAMERGERVLFMVPTRRLAQNLLAGLMESLTVRCGWSVEVTGRKLAEWNSDATKRLKEEGLTAITPHRIREIFGLYPSRDEGEMIVAIPESVSHLLTREQRQRGQTDVGILSLLMNFEHIVFDEFHTISARGFGLAGLVAKLAASLEGARAKVSFLSATPLDIGAVLRRLEVSEEDVKELHEILTSSGRIVHGDVRLVLEEAPSMIGMVQDRREELKQELDTGRQVVIIYDALHELMGQLRDLKAFLQQMGVAPRKALLINSISDSVSGDSGTGFFAMGREHRPETFDVLIATASVEMGVNFRANLIFMDPGFEPMNFLQRYGRAARGDHRGTVFVRWDAESTGKRPWLRELCRCLEEHDGKELEISDLTEILSRSTRLRFEDSSEEDKYFGRLSLRAAYAAGLYWNVIMKHWSSRGARWKHLKSHQPKPAAHVYALLMEVRSMEQDPILGTSVKNWCDAFEAQARIMRDIGARIRVVDSEGVTQSVPILWIQRYTDILQRFPISYSDKDGMEEVVIDDKLDRLTDGRKRYVPAMKNVRFPHTLYTTPIRDNSSLVDEWCRCFTSRNGVEGEAWFEYPEAMAAAEKLVRLTGLVVTDDDEGLELGSSNCIL